MIIQDSYYARKEVSNSDLSKLKQELYPRVQYDATAAYRFGNLIDAMITEPEVVDFFQRRIGDVQFTVEEFAVAERMRAAFYKDEFCRTIRDSAKGQMVMSARRKFDYQGYEFELDTRCKWDLWREDWGWGGDVKSTTATTQKEFEAACSYFDYDRQRAWYMDIAGSDRDVLIGISKKNFKVFKIAINRKSELYHSGLKKYNELAFRWHLIHG
ncbi:MAG: PD-(D/E)XK nuclease-like domain-containing protein [Bacteroidales bacterium]